MQTVNILGTEYTVYIEPTDGNKKLSECNGYTDYTTKEIHLKDFKAESLDLMSLDNLPIYRDKVIRHEIIHAFLLESGLDSNSSYSDTWATNEEMVDFFAMQFPKIHKVYIELGCTGE